MAGPQALTMARRKPPGGMAWRSGVLVLVEGDLDAGDAGHVADLRQPAPAADGDSARPCGPNSTTLKPSRRSSSANTQSRSW